MTIEQDVLRADLRASIGATAGKSKATNGVSTGQ
jgi:hypothetical protein